VYFHSVAKIGGFWAISLGTAVVVGCFKHTGWRTPRLLGSNHQFSCRRRPPRRR